LRKFYAAYLLPLIAGCCAAGNRAEVHYAASVPTVSPAGIVFVADGSGDFRTVSMNLKKVAAEAGVPLEVQALAWSHGYLRYLIDHMDHSNHLEQGRRLAMQVSLYRQAAPNRRIYLIGHSAGCAVVLAAAEMLPPNSVDRIILLAPSVCTSYDLRRALATAYLGVDVFHSSRDRMILGIGMLIVGTAEGGCRTAAGQCGFTPVIATPADAALYAKLRQHPWDPAVEWTGHHGGHYGTNRADFLRAYVLPLLVCS
jgi:pimeloyl-ACP methyl ester carboxylesterase